MPRAPLAVVLDANTLYPMNLRDTLLRLAGANFYQPYWSALILDEMERNLVANAVMPVDDAARLRRVMMRAFPAAAIKGFEHVIPYLENDKKDRHVAAVGSGGRSNSSHHLEPNGL